MTDFSAHLNNSDLIFTHCRELVRQGDYTDVITALEDYISEKGDHLADAYSWIGYAYYMLREDTSASQNLQLSLQSKPNQYRTRGLLACCLLRQDLIDQAVEQMEIATSTTTGDQFIEIMNWWVNAAVHSKSYEIAISACEDMLAVSPDDVGLLAGLAKLYAGVPNDQFRNGSKAIEVATRACEISHWQDWVSLSCLAAAYAESDDFINAIRFAQLSLETSPNPEKEEREQRLKQFKSGIPYRITDDRELQKE